MNLHPMKLPGRRFVAAAILALAAGFAAVGSGQPRSESAAAAVAAPVRAQSVARIGITVSDLDRALEFYTGVLGFTKLDSREESGDTLERRTGVFGARTLTARLRLGEEEIELTQFLAPEGRPIPQDSRSNDRWFQHIAIVVADIDKAYAHLRAHKVRHASSGPQTLPAWNKNAAGISAFYFKDPDGHVLEVIHFPAGKGDPRWQKPAGQLFLGIDHTAIVVNDTAKSLEFYRDVLGMTVAGGSENSGTEQEHLNNVFGARLRITTMKAARGPGVEFLEYLSPTTGRDYPADSSASDLWHWQTTITFDDPAAAARALEGAHARAVSAPPAGGTPGGPVLFRDPDGHAVMIDAPPASR